MDEIKQQHLFVTELGDAKVNTNGPTGPILEDHPALHFRPDYRDHGSSGLENAEQSDR